MKNDTVAMCKEVVELSFNYKFLNFKRYVSYHILKKQKESINKQIYTKLSFFFIYVNYC